MKRMRFEDGSEGFKYQKNFNRLLKVNVASHTCRMRDNPRLPVFERFPLNSGLLAPAVNALLDDTRERSTTANKIHANLVFIFLDEIN